MSKKQVVMNGARRTREVDPRKAVIIRDIEGDECWLYEVGNAVGLGCMPKADNARGCAVILDETRLDAVIDALQEKRTKLYGVRSPCGKRPAPWGFDQ